MTVEERKELKDRAYNWYIAQMGGSELKRNMGYIANIAKYIYLALDQYNESNIVDDMRRYSYENEIRKNPLIQEEAWEFSMGKTMEAHLSEAYLRLLYLFGGAGAKFDQESDDMYADIISKDEKKNKRPFEEEAYKISKTILQVKKAYLKNENAQEKEENIRYIYMAILMIERMVAKDKELNNFYFMVKENMNYKIKSSEYII